MWRIYLNCGCVYLVDRRPDLSKPYICVVLDESPSTHGLNSIMRAENVEWSAQPHEWVSPETAER